jgi:DNA-binding NarL/FixJ family response regulator
VVAVIWIGFDITAKKRAHALQTKQLESLETALRTLSKPEATASESGPESGEVYMLTPREIGVLRLLANGLTNREIAGILCISHHTVKSHVAHVFDKLGVTHRAEAAVKAARLRLI